MPLLFALVHWGEPLHFFLLLSVVIVLAVRELCALAEKQGIRPQRWIGAGGAVLLASSFLTGGPAAGVVLTLIVIATLLCALFSKQEFSGVLASVSVTLFGVAGVGLLLGYQAGLRSVEGVGGDLLLFLLWVVWAGDAAAYFVGCRLGRHPLCARISPGKTMEGGIAGLAASVAAAGAGKIWLLPSLSWPEAAALGGGLALCALAGDLCESLLKRGSQVKDSANLLPGHGGMLDRTDSLLFSAPLLYHYWSGFHP